jgi:hypothetical protein
MAAVVARPAAERKHFGVGEYADTPNRVPEVSGSASLSCTSHFDGFSWAITKRALLAAVASHPFDEQMVAHNTEHLNRAS